MKARLVDLFLLVVIIGSVVLIGFKLLRRDDAPGPALDGQAIGSLRPPPIAGAAPSPSDGGIMTKLKLISNAQWDQALAAAGKASLSVSQTPGCSIPGKQEFPGVIANPIVSRKWEDGASNVLIGLRASHCVRKGSKILLISRPVTDVEPIFDVRGYLAVDRILLAKPPDIPKAIFDFLNFTLAEYSSYVGYQPEAPVETSILRFGPFMKTAKLPDAPIAFLPHTQVYSKVQFSEKQKSKRQGEVSMQLIDVRSPAEFAGGHLDGAINVPYVLPSKVGPNFSWSTTRNDLIGAKFDLRPIFDIPRGTRIVVVGSSPQDPRPVYALLELTGPFSEFGWIYEGMEH